MVAIGGLWDPVKACGSLWQSVAARLWPSVWHQIPDSPVTDAVGPAASAIGSHSQTGSHWILPCVRSALVVYKHALSNQQRESSWFTLVLYKPASGNQQQVNSWFTLVVYKHALSSQQQVSS